MDTMLFYAALTIFAFTVFRRWTWSPWPRLLAVSLFVTSPFLVENLLFTWSQIPLSIALLLLSLWFIAVTCTNAPAQREMSWRAVTLGGIAAALAIAIRGELVFLLVGAAAIEMTRALLQDNHVFPNRLLPIFASLIIAVLTVALLTSGAVALGSKGFFPAASTSVNELVTTPAAFREVFVRFLTYWKFFLFKPHYLFPAAMKVLVWVIVASAVLQSLLARDWARLVAVLVIGVLLSALPLALGLTTQSFPYVFAAVFPLALFPCFLACMAMTVPSGRPVMRGAACVAAVMIVVMSASSLSSAQVRLANLNRRDVSTITQFLAVIQSTGEANWKLAVAGNYSSGLQFSWAKNREQCSAFDCGTALEPLLRMTLLQSNPESRVFQLTGAEQAQLQPELEALPPGSARLVRLDKERFVILLK